MRPLVLGSIAATVVCLATFSAHTVAQGNDRQWFHCADIGRRLPADVTVTSCTTIIRSGRESRGSLAIAFFSRGNGYEREGNNARAIADYSEAIRLNPNFAQAYHNRGVAYRERQDYARAIVDFSEAIRLRPRFVRAYRNRAALYQRMNDPARAAEDIRVADRLDGLPRRPD